MPQRTEIDFTKYRTADLVETIAEIICLPGALRSIAKWTGYGLIGLMILVLIFLKLTGNLTIFWTGLFELYASIAGAIGGTALGIAEFIRRSLGNMTRLVDLLLETTKQVAKDSRGLYAGDKKMPPARDLVDDVYHEVILITLKQVVFEMFGFFGRPVYWFYHLTLNQFVRAAIRLIPRGRAQTPKEFASTIDEISNDEGMLISSLQWTQESLQSFGGWVKLLVMTPCYAVLAIVIGVILMPLILVWLFWMTGTPQPADPEAVSLLWTVIASKN